MGGRWPLENIQSIWLERFYDLGFCLRAMASPSAPLHERSLASWKTWWGPSLAKSLADSFHANIDPKNLPGKGVLLSTSHFTGDSLKESHVASLLEAMLLVYPGKKQPSGYLLGDAVIGLDNLWNGSLLGGIQQSPIKEMARRDAALGEGGKLKKLLSYARTSALKSENGKTPEITYLKALANKRLFRDKTTTPSESSNAANSPRSFYSGTTMVLG